MRKRRRARTHATLNRMYQRPNVPGVELELSPVLESWNSRDHPDQVRLREFLDAVEDVACHAGVETNLALELQVGLPQSKPLMSGGGDLDNCLFPIARRLGAERFAAVFGTKRHDPPI